MRNERAVLTDAMVREVRNSDASNAALEKVMDILDLAIDPRAEADIAGFAGYLTARYSDVK